MNKQKSRPILDVVASDHIPADLNLLPRITAQLQQEEHAMLKSHRRLVWTLILVLIGLGLLSTVAYALFTYFGDPGLRSVQEAGLVEPMHITAQPTIQPTATPLRTPLPALDAGLSQTLEGVTLALDWVYLDEGHLALGLKFTDLPAGVTLDAPVVKFRGVTPDQAHGYSMGVRGGDRQAVYLSYQVIHADAVGGKVAIGLDVPLVQVTRAKKIPLANFHFDLTGVPVYTGQNLLAQQTYAVRHNGVELRLLSARVLDTTTEIVACASTAAQPGTTRYFTKAVVQIGDSAEVSETAYQQVRDSQPGYCARLTFSIGNPGRAPRLIFRVYELAGGISGPWEFTVALPAQEIVPQRDAPTPTAAPANLGEQSIEGVTMSLDWVFADARRVAFGYTISGLPDVPDALGLSGRIVVKDAQGSPVGEAHMNGGPGTAQRVPGKPGTFTGTWSTLLPEPLDQPEADFTIDFTLDGSQGYSSRNMAAYIVQPAGWTPPPPGTLPPAYPDRLVGTFHFATHATVYPMQVIKLSQPVEANGITMRLEGAEITPSYARFTLCYPKPSAKDWGFGGFDAVPTLKAGEYEAPLHGYSLLADPDLGGYLKGAPPDAAIVPSFAANERCVTIDFLLGHTGPAQSLTLTIPRLEQSVPEVIPDAEFKAAQEQLRTEGIKVEYTTVSSAGGGGGGGPVFTQKPAGMSDMDALQRLYAILGYDYSGPWVFNIEVKQ